MIVSAFSSNLLKLFLGGLVIIISYANVEICDIVFIWLSKRNYFLIAVHLFLDIGFILLQFIQFPLRRKPSWDKSLMKLNRCFYTVYILLKYLLVRHLFSS